MATVNFLIFVIFLVSGFCKCSPFCQINRLQGKCSIMHSSGHYFYNALIRPQFLKHEYLSQRLPLQHQRQRAFRFCARSFFPAIHFTPQMYIRLKGPLYSKLIVYVKLFHVISLLWSGLSRLMQCGSFCE